MDTRRKVVRNRVLPEDENLRSGNKKSPSSRQRYDIGRKS